MPSRRSVARIDGTPLALAPASKVSATTGRLVGMTVQSFPEAAGYGRVPGPPGGGCRGATSGRGRRVPGDDGGVAGTVAGGRDVGLDTDGAAVGVTGVVAPCLGVVCLTDCAPPQAARPTTAAAATARRTTRVLLMLSPYIASRPPAAVLRPLPGTALTWPARAVRPCAPGTQAPSKDRRASRPRCPA